MPNAIYFVDVELENRGSSALPGGSDTAAVKVSAVFLGHG